MKQDRLAELMQSEADMARALIEDSHGEVISHFIGDSDEGEFCIVAPWSNSLERTVTLITVRGIFREKKVKRYLHVSEAWMAPDSDVQPSKSPARLECLFIAGVDRPNKTKRFWIFPIERLADGSRRLGKKDEKNPTDVGGDSFTILDPDPALH